MYLYVCIICMNVYTYIHIYIYIIFKIYMSILMCLHTKSFQSCVTLCDPMDCSPPGSPVRRSLQARILEWVAIPSSRGSSPLRD